MPRPAMTPAMRAQKVSAAIVALPDAISVAVKSGSVTDWERVEELGAIVHRQSRLLAGKSKGG